MNALGDYAPVLAVLFGGLVLAIEIARPRVPGRVDFLRFPSALFLVCFSVIPIFLFFLEERDLGPWNWLFLLPSSHSAFSFAIIVAGLAYVSTVGAYLFPLRTATFEKEIRRMSLWPTHSTSLAIGVALLLFSIACVIGYSFEVGGLDRLILEAGRFRSGEPFRSTGFLIKLAPVCTVSAMIFLAIALDRGPSSRAIALILFVIALAVSAFVLFHLGGRVQFLFFVLSLYVGIATWRGGFRISETIALLFFASLVVLFGKEMLWMFLIEDAISNRLEEISQLGRAAEILLMEFTFPYVNVASILVLVPHELSLRWFIDVPLGLLWTMPKLIFENPLPPTITMVYDDLIVTPSPIDLVSFGYTSAGAIGVILVAAVLGAILRFAETWFGDRNDALTCMFRSAWLLFLGSQVMYGMPHHAFTAGTPLALGTIILILASRTRLTMSVRTNPARP